MIESFFVRSAVVIRAPLAEDRYHHQSPDWQNATRAPAVGVWLAQQSATETVNGRDTTVTTYTLQGPAGMDLRPLDRVEIDGALLYEVEGDPNPAWTPRGEHHIEATLKRVTG